MANILTATEAADIVSVDPTDSRLLMILPQVDSTIQEATGRDWTQGSPIHPIAKRAAMCRLAVDYDLGAMNPQQTATMERAYLSAITQLESIQAGMQALQNINSAVNADDMLVYLQSDTLGLNLIDFKRLSFGGQEATAKAVLDARPVGNYADTDAVQTALDTAMKAVVH
ncbi:hypothetical protein ACVS9P_02465 [Caproicibacterium sp. NSD3]